MKYIANPVEVDAFKINNVAPIESPNSVTGEYELMLEGVEWPRKATREMCARMKPTIGDYYVIQSDGYVYLNPKYVFERKYSPVKYGPDGVTPKP